MQKMVIVIKANTYNSSNLSKLGPRVVAHIILSHPSCCGVPYLGLGVMSTINTVVGGWGDNFHNTWPIATNDACTGSLQSP
jgi:hypothetical protein